MNANMVAVVSLSLDDFTDLEISTAMNALSGFGRINKESLVYETALDHSLIKENGMPTFDLEDILVALNHQTRNRPAFGLTGT